MNKKQKTLFESWNKCSSRTTTNESTSKQNETNTLPSCSFYNSPNHNIFQHSTFSKATNQLVDKGFDYDAGKTWIYPTNYPIRDYQFSIVKEALFKNTLVILPTGLGKTFIAAVVMYNIYRWYPGGKIVFMAPTRPLVAQQIDACYKITGIPDVDTTQMTGTNMPEERKRMWMKKRVFFLTPQVLVNDLARNICPAESIKCIVIDEAHKALGNHAYCQVIRELQAYTTHFRILALTATPGSDTQAVKLLLSNLLISHVEMRTEDSDDVKQYTHVRDIEKIVVPLGERLLSIKRRFLDVINIYLKRLTQKQAMTAKNPTSLSKFQIFRMREDFSQHPPNNINKFSYGLIMADFSLCISLYHAYELLLLHGARPFYNFLTGILNGDKSIPHARSELLKNYDFEVLLKEIQENYIVESTEGDQNMAANIDKKMPGHPKLQKLLEVVLHHFSTINKDLVRDTRVMIFSQYRDSVQEIADMLNHHKPMIKVMSFIGQSSKSATNAGFSQKQQLKVIQQFRSGGYNTLVSTCVGEEGLDIGEVDLIVCYDCPKSPIRLVQRMGRTGRLRRGRIIILIAEGKEEQMYNSCESKKKSVHRAISKGFAFAQLYHNSPSLLPPGVKPVCVKTAISVEAQRPPIKLKGKLQDDGFLNEDELSEFKTLYKAPKCDFQLLPNSEMVCLKASGVQGNVSDSECSFLKGLKSRLSLSNWLLWQTTPQRTHMVTHSSRSLLLINTVEKINFPTENSSDHRQVHEETKYPSEMEICASEKESVPPVIDLCDDDYGFNNFEESFSAENHIVEDLNAPDSLTVSVPYSRDLHDHISASTVTTTVNPVSDKKDNLLKRMFGISFIKLPCKYKYQDLEPPPLLSDSITLQDLSNIHIEATPRAKSKSCLILNILNKKMKARLKRKTKELGINFSFGEELTLSSKKNIMDSSFACQSDLGRKIASNSASSQCESDKFNKVELDKKTPDQTMLPKCITFDIDFDVPQVIDENKSKTVLAVSSNEMELKQNDSTIAKNENNYPNNLDADSNEILEQFFSSKDDKAKKLESSFTLPLTVKKVFDSMCETPKKAKKIRSVLRDKNEVAASNNQNKVKSSGIMLGVSNRSVLLKSGKKHLHGLLNMTKHSSPENPQVREKNSEENAKNEEFSQYTLTQLLSLIDNTGSFEGGTKDNKNKGALNTFNQSTSKENCSSDEEIEPTPPKKIINTTSKFFYRSNSLNIDSNSMNKDDLPEAKRETRTGSDTFPSISFDLKNVQFSEMYANGKISPNFMNTKKNLQNINPDVPKEITSSLNDGFSISFDLCNETVEDELCHAEFKPSKIYEEFSEDKEQNPCEIKITGSPINSMGNISFDLFDIDSPKNHQNDAKSSKSHITKNILIQNKDHNASLKGTEFLKCDNTELKQPISDGFSNNVQHLPKTKVTCNPVESTSGISFDLSDIQFPQSSNENKNHSKKNPSPIKNSLEDKNEALSFFESAAVDKLFFDISFDFPDFKAPSPQNELAKKLTNSVIENIVQNTVIDSMSNVSSNKNPAVTANAVSKINNIYANNTLEKPSANTKDTEWKKEVPAAKDIKTTNDVQPGNKRSIDKDFQVSGSEDFFVPQISKKGKTLSSTKVNRNEAYCKQSLNKKPNLPESSELFECNKLKKDQNTILVTSKHAVVDQIQDHEFKEPASKKSKTNAGNKKKKCIKDKNRFLLTQASVSGTDSSDADAEDHDSLEASFIDDNTILESPPNQRCMYLESVKNCAGLPQKYKLKAARNWADQSIAQPPDEGCSKYLLDSFCVDDAEIMFVSSDEEVRTETKTSKVRAVERKRKRIVTFSESSSSEEETFVKKIKTPGEEKFVKKLTPEYSSQERKMCRKLKQKAVVLSSGEDDSEDPCKDFENRLSRKDNANIVQLCSSNITCTKDNPVLSEEELWQHSESIIATKTNCPNFSFDLEWDDAISLSALAETETLVSSVSKSIPSPILTNVSNKVLNSKIPTALVESRMLHAPHKLQNLLSKKNISSTANLNNATSIKSQTPSSNAVIDLKSSAHVSAVEHSACTSTSSFMAGNSTNNINANKTILVDSRELASGKPVISFLRNKFKMNPVVMQLTAADYIISNKVAVERILDSDFPGSVIPLKIIEKVKAMSELYEKPFVIIETDNRKRSLGFNKLSTKYLQFSICVNAHPSVKVLYSNSVDDTSSLLFSLYEKERQKGLHIAVPVVLYPSSQKLFNFYQSIPHVSQVCALNFVYHFPSIGMLFKSSVEQLKKAGCISSHKAKGILQYLSNELLYDAFS